MHSIVVWPVLTFAAGLVALAVTIEDSANRSFFYWLVLPPLLFGALAICSQLASS
jgi:hypothetical protein